jgi:hypothetical protein
MSRNPMPLLRVADGEHFWTVDSTPADAGEALIGWRNSGLDARRLRGEKMRTVNGLFDEFAAVLQFPHYFGENWDAFDECLSDMHWLRSSSGIILLVANAEQVLLDDPGELPVLVRGLASASTTYARPIDLGEWWDRPAVPFHVVLLSSSETARARRTRWESAGASLMPLAG